jgi:hypothetical protein
MPFHRIWLFLLVGLAIAATLRLAAAQIKASHADSVGATAHCGDGTYSHVKAKKGVCSRHGGIAEWLRPPPVRARPFAR